MARKKVVSSKTVRGRDGKKAGSVLSFDDGSKRTVLNPHGKGRKYAAELRSKSRMTNDGEVKRDKSGKPMTLSKAQRSFRSGYLQAQKDNAKAYKTKTK